MHKVKCFLVLLCITNNSVKHQSFVYTQLNVPRVLFLKIWFNISHLFVQNLKRQNNSILPIYRTLPGATTPGQSGPGSNDHEEVFHILLNSKAGTSPSDSLMLYPGQLLGDGGFDPLQGCSWCILQSKLTGLPNLFRYLFNTIVDAHTCSLCLCLYMFIHLHLHGHSDTSSNPGHDWLHFTQH